MIQPDAKCVVNGAKVNEAIMALNPLLAMSVGYIAGGKPPQVTYNDGEVKILLPLADSVDGFSLEELDIVDTNNAASSRYFMTSSSSVSTYGTTTASTSGTPTGKQSTPQPTNKDRNRLGNTPSNKNRDKLDKGAAPIGNGGAMPAGMVKPGSQAAKDGFNDAPRMGGAMVKPGSQAAKDGFNDTPRMGGAMVAPGSQAANEGFNDVSLPGAPPLGGDTTPAPLPGAPPLGGDTTPNTKNRLSSEASAFGQTLAAKTQRDNQEANQNIYEQAAAIRENNKKKTEQARAYKAKIAAGNLARKAAGDELAAKADKRAQSNIKAASSTDRTAKIAMLKEQLTSVVRELARVDDQIARDRSNRKIHSSSSPLMMRREQLEAERKRISGEMTSL
jgi:hypothetical protein